MIENFFELEYYAKCAELIFAFLFIMAGLIYTTAILISNRISEKKNNNNKHL